MCVWDTVWEGGYVTTSSILGSVLQWSAMSSILGSVLQQTVHACVSWWTIASMTGIKLWLPVCNPICRLTGTLIKKLTGGRPQPVAPRV